jgi:tRNA pseudouridine55 synthase
MSFDLVKGEIILVNKPYRWTSFDVVNYTRNIFRTEMGIKKYKIGHTGTLDPLATGLLILCTGQQTKKIEDFKDLDKEYTGTFTLGATTPSFDMEKPVNLTFPWEHITEGMVLETAKKLSGTYGQVPPVFSAVKIKGKRAYDYARKDQEVVIVSRQISIAEFEVTRVRLPEVDFRIVCSKGTYIRAIARDFGLELNSGAYLSALCRTRIGPYKLADALETTGLQEFILGK